MAFTVASSSGFVRSTPVTSAPRKTPTRFTRIGESAAVASGAGLLIKSSLEPFLICANYPPANRGPQSAIAGGPPLCPSRRQRHAIDVLDLRACQAFQQQRLDLGVADIVPEVEELAGIGLEVVELAPRHAMIKTEAPLPVDDRMHARRPARADERTLAVELHECRVAHCFALAADHRQQAASLNARIGRDARAIENGRGDVDAGADRSRARRAARLRFRPDEGHAQDA